jgi:hypothetical protein
MSQSISLIKTCAAEIVQYMVTLHKNNGATQIKKSYYLVKMCFLPCWIVVAVHGTLFLLEQPLCYY